MHELKAWARRRRVEPTGKRPRPLRMDRLVRTAGDDTAEACVGLGPEAWICSPELRIRGRADQVEWAPDGVLEISDFKSGFVAERDEGTIPGYALQLGLYGLAAEAVVTPSGMRLCVEGAERTRIEWPGYARAHCH